MNAVGKPGRQSVMRPFVLVLFALTTGFARAEYTLTVLHTGPMRGQVEPIKVEGRTYGGYPRLVTEAKRCLTRDTNPLLVGSGNTFGSGHYSTMYHGLADVALMNLAGYRAMGLGESDLSMPSGTLNAFVAHAAFPFLCCNLDQTPAAFLRERVHASQVLTIGGQSVGIIGVARPDTGKDASDSVQAEVRRLSLQGVNKIVLLSDLDLDENRKVAEKVAGVDVIVSGHEGRILGPSLGRDFSDPVGPYPIEVKSGDRRTLLVSAGDRGELLGRIIIRFDDDGKILGWREAAMIILNSTVGDDPAAAALAAAFAAPIHVGDGGSGNDRKVKNRF